MITLTENAEILIISLVFRENLTCPFFHTSLTANFKFSIFCPIVSPFSVILKNYFNLIQAILPYFIAFSTSSLKHN